MDNTTLSYLSSKQEYNLCIAEQHIQSLKWVFCKNTKFHGEYTVFLTKMIKSSAKMLPVD